VKHGCRHCGHPKRDHDHDRFCDVCEDRGAGQCPGFLGPEEKGGAALVCLRPAIGNHTGCETTIWTNGDEAQQAQRELTPCSAACIGQHMIVVAEGDTVRVLRRAPEPPPDLGTELEDLYPRTALDDFAVPPEYWPVDPDLNEPFGEREPQHSALAEKVGRGEAVALARMVAEAPRIATLAGPQRPGGCRAPGGTARGDTAEPGFAGASPWSDLPPLIPPPTVAERFGLYTRKTIDGHLVWLGATTADGHPVFWDGEKLVAARRWAYEHVNGPIPEGRRLRSCIELTRCVSADHLQLQSPGRNSTCPSPTKPAPPASTPTCVSIAAATP
jgi:hypothetical protein